MAKNGSFLPKMALLPQKWLFLNENVVFWWKSQKETFFDKRKPFPVGKVFFALVRQTCAWKRAVFDSERIMFCSQKVAFVFWAEKGWLGWNWRFWSEKRSILLKRYVFSVFVLLRMSRSQVKKSCVAMKKVVWGKMRLFWMYFVMCCTNSPHYHVESHKKWIFIGFVTMYEHLPIFATKSTLMV